MKAVQLVNKMSEEEYFLLEEKSELKHELLNHNLYERSGVSIYNDIIGNLYFLLRVLLKGVDLKVVFENYKIKTPNRNYFYPDIAVYYPKVEKYSSDNPILLVEILSDSTRKFNLTDKFIQYQKIETLQYYLCVEPEQQAVIFYSKQDDSEWTAETLTKDEHVIALPKLNISFSLRDIYHP